MQGNKSSRRRKAAVRDLQAETMLLLSRARAVWGQCSHGSPTQEAGEGAVGGMAGGSVPR